MYIRAYSDPFYISWNNACTARYGVDIHSVTEWEGGRAWGGEERRGEERRGKGRRVTLKMEYCYSTLRYSWSANLTCET